MQHYLNIYILNILGGNTGIASIAKMPSQMYLEMSMMPSIGSRLVSHSQTSISLGILLSDCYIYNISIRLCFGEYI